MAVSVSQGQSVEPAVKPVVKPAPAAVPPEPVWRFSVEQYHEMISTAILTADDQVELLEGWLIHKRPKNPPHRIATKLIQQVLDAVIPSGWYVDSQEPITLEDSEPEPDVAVIRGQTRDYVESHPGAPDLALIIEVADATLERDRKLKKRLYARAGISAYWIVNLAEQKIESYSLPDFAGDEPDYTSRQDYGLAEAIPVLIESREIARIAVKDMLP